MPRTLQTAIAFCRRCPHVCLWRTFLVLVLVVLWSWAIDRDPPRVNVVGAALPRGKPPETVDPDYLAPFARGEDFHGKWSLTITRACPGRVARWVTSITDPSWLLVLPSEELSAYQNLTDPPQLPARRWLQVVSWRVPDHAPLGEAAYHVQASFFCNPLHRLIPITVNYPVIKFQITERQARTSVAPWGASSLERSALQ